MTHRIASGEIPAVGMRVFDNNLDRGVIVAVATDEGCGPYCKAWHTILVDTDYRGNPITPHKEIMNCSRLATRFEGEKA